MLHIELNYDAKRTYSNQIYFGLRRKILSGEIQADEALPPYRQLSQELCVSKNTVLTAYDMLVSDGILYSVPGSGFYVAPGIKCVKNHISPSPTATQSSALSNLTIPQGVINFDNGQPAIELFPRRKWNKAVSAAMMNASAEVLGYDTPQGRPELRSAICGYLNRTLNLVCSPEHIIITNGAKQSISLVLECILRDQEVWIEDPAPALLRQLISHYTENIVAFPVDKRGMNPAKFPSSRKPALIIVSPSRHFPSGAVMPMARRIELIEFAERTGAYILEDNFECEFNYETPPASSLYELASGRVISVGTFSKVLYPSVRLGYVVVPEILQVELIQRKLLSDHHSNPIYQLALASFIADGTLEKHIHRMKKEYRLRRNHLITSLQKNFGNDIEIKATSSGMNLLVAFRSVDFTDKLVQLLLTNGVYAMPVEQQSIFRGQHSNELILRYAGLTRDEIEQGVQRLWRTLMPYICK